jgi:hypothetical protein
MLCGYIPLLNYLRLDMHNFECIHAECTKSGILSATSLVDMFWLEICLFSSIPHENLYWACMTCWMLVFFHWVCNASVCQLPAGYSIVEDAGTVAYRQLVNRAMGALAMTLLSGWSWFYWTSLITVKNPRRWMYRRLCSLWFTFNKFSMQNCGWNVGLTAHQQNYGPKCDLIGIIHRMPWLLWKCSIL